ncbi:MAG TPA: class I SAM-dependent methyltransferase [Candidatus Acidoferrales bacterium]|nr:class I SAM-dependent methyltransferase [Candidatus Acidoferrales bacterium]
MISLGPTLDELLRELEIIGGQNDQHETDRKKKFLNLERPTAELIYILLQASRSKKVLEIGTSNGYSTIWISAALRHLTDARFVSIDILPEKVALARTNLARANFEQRVQLIEGNATDVIARLDGPFDCVFFDADRVSAPAQLRLLLPKLADGALLLADNALSHPAEISEYRTMVEALPDFVWTLVPAGKGLHISWRREGAGPSEQ